MSRTRLCFVRYTSEWDIRKCLSKFYKLKRYHERVSISQSLIKYDEATKRNLLQKRYEIINTVGMPWEEIKGKGLKLFKNGTEVTFEK